jgi:AcrR family transcriptional regulator
MCVWCVSGRSLAHTETRYKAPEIIAAATSLVAKRGVDATSTRDVLDAAGVREATIYPHFREKAVLL